MPRFSLQSKKLFDLIWYNADVESAKKILAEIINPSDIVFGKIWIAYYYLWFWKADLALAELKEAEFINETHQDMLNTFFIHSINFAYNVGWDDATVDSELADKFFKSIENVFQNIKFFDDWEKNFCRGWFYYMKSNYTVVLESNFSSGIEFLEKMIELWKVLPIDGEYLSKAHGTMYLAYLNIYGGNFDSSEELLNNALIEFKKYNSEWIDLMFNNFTWLYFDKGDLDKSYDFSKQLLESSNSFNDTKGIFVALEFQGNIFFEKGNYEHSLELYQECLKIRKIHSTPLSIFFGYAHIFDYYYKRFKITRSKEYLKEAEKMLNEIKGFAEQYSNDKTMVNFTKKRQGFLFTCGNIDKRAKAILIFEELIKIYPNYYDVYLEYLEVLFDDYLLSEDEDTIVKIDKLLEKFNKIPLHIKSIQSYISQKILIAKYQFFVKANYDLAFQYLNDARFKVEENNLENFALILENELMNLKSESDKKEIQNKTLKERFEKFHLAKYMQEAKKLTQEA